MWPVPQRQNSVVIWRVCSVERCITSLCQLQIITVRVQTASQSSIQLVRSSSTSAFILRPNNPLVLIESQTAVEILQTSKSNCFSVISAPCTVQNMLTTLNCTTNILTISWTPGSMPVNYSTTAVMTNGTTLRCVTQSSSCTMPELQCGQQYSVRVKPISSICEGPSSVPEIVNSGILVDLLKFMTLRAMISLDIKMFFFCLPFPLCHIISLTVPCVPVNIQTLVECSTNRVWGSWDAAPGAMYYISTLKGAGGFSTSCQTANQRCLFSGLQCAQTYMFSVMASNNRCNSSNSVMDTATTGKIWTKIFFVGCESTAYKLDLLTSDSSSWAKEDYLSVHFLHFDFQHPVTLQTWLLLWTASLMWWRLLGGPAPAQIITQSWLRPVDMSTPVIPLVLPVN